MFALLGLALAVGVVTGLATGGSAAGLKELQLRWSPLLFAGLVIGLVPLFAAVPGWVRTLTLIVSLLTVLAWIVVNVAGSRGAIRVGLGVIALGWALNFVVIAANGAMPLSTRAYERSGQTERITGGEGGFFKIELAGSDTRLRHLGDVIPVRAIKQVLSIGDVFLIAGVAATIAAGMHHHRTPARDER